MHPLVVNSVQAKDILGSGGGGYGPGFYGGDISDANNYSVAQEFAAELLPSSGSQNVSDWGPKRDPLYIVVPMTIIYVIIFLTGLVGNASTCIVISRNKAMHTATNYYLFSLAISDLLLLISGLPPEIYFIWSKYPYIFGEVFCMIQGFAAETSANATVLTITAFTVERYVAICHPFLSHTMSKLSRAIRFIVAIWVVAMCLAIPQAMAFGIYYEGISADDEHYVCIVKRVVIPHAFEISTFVFFVAPMTLITILYILIGLQLHRSTVRPSRGNSVRMSHRVVTYANASTQAVLIRDGDDNEMLQVTAQEEDGRKNYARNSQATRHVVKMLVAVVVAFFICWAPFHAQRLLAIYGERTSANMITAFRILTYISGVLYYLSTTVNPLLYHIMSHKFRQAFKETFAKFCRRGRRPPGGRCYTTLSGRSSQVNSHSNTDSCSRQSSIRYLEAEVARLQDPASRPMVVSFRWTKKPKLAEPAKPARGAGGLLDAQEALFDMRNKNQGHGQKKTIEEVAAGKLQANWIELHHLEPKHFCPGRRVVPSPARRRNVADSPNKRRRGGSCRLSNGEKKIPKSTTMPHIGVGGEDGDEQNASAIAERSPPNGKYCSVCNFKVMYVDSHEKPKEDGRAGLETQRPPYADILM